ncbi:ATPase BadF/BadG/BcrA/BcrD type [Ketogulonicigenium robustum]|uniref:ATPase BadF/BadG/BcrA/BcrD type n=1 Tax=Ketogulonicigenium robustum TaxID=92947 RepID=A0A1W6P1T5_9RHOB|nr:BadF/BadG/BcrA/BcrD ATPase family protein [Ketogulonicigenium robustum]ARO15468.1 ATPase BadF/BadG/BcrA/BcrD type [Ketogulonicigenium robustum]
MSYYLGIDVGGTGTRWVVIDDAGHEVTRGRTDGATGLIYDAASLAAFVGAMEAVREGSPGPLAFVHLGITGAGFNRHANLDEQIKLAFRLPDGAFSYSNDMELAWHAAFPDGRGHLVSAGTGSIGLTFKDGERIAVGGRGILIDDGGSGTWIGLRALDRLYRLIDEKGAPEGAEILAEKLFGAMGGADWDATRAFVYGKDRGQIGTLAVAVAEAAHLGDPIALDMMTRAGTELARLALALVDRAGPAPLGFVGGVMKLHPAIQAGVAAALQGYDLQFPLIDAAHQAARIARAAAHR